MPAVTPPGEDPEAAALWAPFRPVRSRRSALVFAVGQAVVLLALAFVVPGATWIDRIGFAVVAAGIGWLLLRFALLRAVPGQDGLVVQNLIRREELRWEQVVAVRFGGGNPWVTLDLSDGDVLAVMAIQRADGAHATAEARRLATLVAGRSATSADD